MSVETYHCRRCDARFGIAGESTGSLEDIEADEHFAEEVAYHEGEHCPPRPGTKGRRTPKRSTAVAAQRAHGQALRESLRAQAAKVQAAITKRREQRAKAKAEQDPPRPVEYLAQHRGAPHDVRRARLLQRRSDARANARYDRRQERATQVAEAAERGIPGTLLQLPPMRRWDDGTVSLTPSSNVPHVNPARDAKPKARLR